MLIFKLNGASFFVNTRNPKIISSETLDSRKKIRFAKGMIFFALLSGILMPVSNAQTLSTLAGNRTQGFSGDGGPATSASFQYTNDMTRDANGNIYIADSANNRIRKIAIDGTISTVAGTSNQGFSGDGGLATVASLSSPGSVAFDAVGNMYISDTGNHRIRMVSADGVISTIAGNGFQGDEGDGGPALSARLNYPGAIKVRGGEIYFAGGNRIRKIASNGIIITVVGSGQGGFAGDGGPATGASLGYPRSFDFDSDGNMYIAEYNNQRIRKVASNGVISTLAGNGNASFTGDGGQSTNATLNYPSGLSVDSSNNIYIADSNNNRIRKISPTGLITTVAGNGTQTVSPDGAAATSGGLGRPVTVLAGDGGAFYFDEQSYYVIRKVSISPPSPPIVGIATAYNGRATLSFTAPANNGGSAITGYTVTSSPSGGVDNDAGSTSLLHTISGLTNGTAYTFTVAATSAQGQSGSSGVSNSVVPTNLPGAPAVTGVVAGNGQASVSFSAPFSDGESPITGYTVSSSPSGGVDTNSGSNSLTHVVTGLTNGVAYTFTVRASNANGIGTASLASAAVTPATIPDAPPAPAAVAGNTVATVSITSPANNGGSPITGYTVTSSPSGGVDSNAGTTSLSHLITGLTNGTHYTFTVIANNLVGASAASLPSNDVLPASISSAPIMGTAAAGIKQAIVNFSPPANNGGAPIIGYTVTSIPAGGVDINAGSTALTHNVQGLNNGVPYTFVVRASNGTGLSPASANSNIVTPAGLPGAPAPDSVVAGNAQAIVSFTPPQDNGGSPITGYQVISSPTGGVDTQVDTLSTSHLVTGLKNGTSYTFKIRARNAMGLGAESTQTVAIIPSTNAPVALYVTDAVVKENRLGTVTATINVKLSKASASTVNYDIATSGGTATANTDYVSRSLNAQVIPAGTTSVNFDITINGDTIPESEEIFYVNVSNVSGATLADGQGTVTIRNNAGTENVINTFAGGSVGDNIQATQSVIRPVNVTTDAAGNVYASDLARVRKISPDGIITTVAGNGIMNWGVGTFSGDNGPATEAGLYTPTGLLIDPAGNLYIADLNNNRIRKVTPAGIITTVAGGGSLGVLGDGGPATSAWLNNPNAIAMDASGNLFITDNQNHRIRKVTPAGIISTYVGTGSASFCGDGGPASSACIAYPYGLAFDTAGNLFISDTGNGRIRKVDTNGVISTIAGRTDSSYSADGGQALGTGLGGPQGLAFDSAGNLYFATPSRIRKIATNGIISTVAGNGFTTELGDGGQATSATLSYAADLAFDASGNMVIADANAYRIRKVNGNGIISTLAGNGKSEFFGDGQLASNAKLSLPTSGSFDRQGNMLIADTGYGRIRKINVNGVISTIVGTMNLSAQIGNDIPGDGGPAINAHLNEPTGVVEGSDGSLYIADYTNDRIRKVSPSGIISTIAIFQRPHDIAIDANDNLFVTEQLIGRIQKLAPNGVISLVAGGASSNVFNEGGAATAAYINQPTGMVMDALGNIYYADGPSHVVRKISPSGIVTTVAGSFLSNGYSGDCGQARNAKLDFPLGVAIDRSGNLFINDGYNHRVRKVTADGIITTVAGIGVAGYSGDGGPALAAKTSFPPGVIVDASGDVYIVEHYSNRIRKFKPLTVACAPQTVTATAGNGQVNVSFTPATTDGGSPITGYLVSSTIGAGVDRDAGSPALNHLVTGLVNGTSYQFTVQPINAIGTGLVSQPSNSVVPTATTAPTLSVSDASIVEGNSGARVMSFTVTLSAPAPVPGVRFDVATSPALALERSARAGADYSSLSLVSASIPAGQSSAVFNVKIIGDTAAEPDEIFNLRLSNIVGATAIKDVATGTIINDDSLNMAGQSPSVDVNDSEPASREFTAIHAIQGNGLISPMLGHEVVTVGIVTALRADGFLMQSRDSDKDADAETSNAISVITGARSVVTVGALVRVHGRVEEKDFGSKYFTLTSILADSVRVEQRDQALPQAVVISSNDLSARQSMAWLERYESMRMRLPRMKVVGPVGGKIDERNSTAVADGIFHVVLQGAMRPFREAGSHPLSFVEKNSAAKLTISDGNPELLRINSSGQTGAKRIAVDTGDIISGLAGVLLDGNAGRELLTDPNASISTIAGATPRAVTIPKASEITIGNMSMRRLFDDTDNSSRKEPVLTRKAYSQRLAKAANTLCSYMQAPDIVGLADIENQSVLTDIAAATNDKVGDLLFHGSCKRDPDYSAVSLSDTNNDELDSGFLISNVDARPGVKRVDVLSVERIAESVKFSNPDGTVVPLYARPPILLRARVNSRSGQGKVLSILLNHWRSGIEAEDNAPGVHGWRTRGEQARAMRLSQANHLAGWLRKRAAAIPDERMVVQGGFDTPAFTDGQDDLMQIVSGREPNQSILNLTLLQPASERYSFVRDGQAQALDHFLVNFGNNRHARVEYARINADFGEDNFGDFTVPVRSSDRDPSVFYWDSAESD